VRTLSFLLLTIVCIQSPSLFTVVLKSGRTVKGTRVSEDSSSIQIKDNNGVVLSFRKTILDLKAMDAANKQLEFSHDETDRALAQETPKTLVELATETKKNRNGTARVLTNQDLDGAPQITILGSAQPERNRIDSSSVPSKEERYWRNAATELREDIAKLQERRISAETSCENAREKKVEQRSTPHKINVDFFSLYDEPAECKKLQLLDRQLDEARSRMESFEDQARHAGVPWQWLE
jgi:hypothetical protein